MRGGSDPDSEATRKVEYMIPTWKVVGHSK